MSTQAELPAKIKEPGTYGITDSWAVTKRLKTAESLIKAVKDRLTENKAYEGDNKGYRNYFRTTLSILSKTGLQHLEHNIKNMPEEPLSEEQWEALYSRNDLQLIYDIVLATVAVPAHNIVTNAAENGVISLHGLYKLWGSQTIANSITAFNDILSLHVEKHIGP
ncbi:hypothetical protein RI054_13g64110 [Pseudoscourfieldia marina]